MKKCNKCNINYNTDRFTCPFCKSTLDEIEPKATYQSYPKFKDKIYKVNVVQKAFIFLTIIASIIVMITNYYEYKQGLDSLWSIIVLIGLITIWSFIKGLIISKKNLSKRIILFGFSLILLILSIEYLSITHKGNYTNWGINYVIPFILISILTAINFTIIIRKKNFSDHIGYALWTSLLLIAYHSLYIFNITNILWTSLSCFIYGICSIIAFFFFGGKSTIQELKKRLPIQL